ncbi:MAG: helix-turn-helix transcriptional regulator [Clostridia bacterium]|nr:helix-turn-helix transcriptional regulator [Clostridia bacterium]
MKNNKSRFIKTTLKNIINISRLVTVYCYDLSPNFSNEGETHDFWEIVYMDHGEATVRAGKRSLVLHQGEMIFHKPNEFHNIACDGAHSAYVFIMTFDCHSVAMKYFCDRVIKIPTELSSMITMLIDESTKTFQGLSYPLTVRRDAPLGGEQMIRLYLESFLIRLMRQSEDLQESKTLFTSKETLENTLTQEICTYLGARVHQKLTLKEVSEHFHFGKTHLCEVFKKNTGSTIIGYFLDLKIKEAKRMLKEEHYTISEISERLAFESPAYFSRIFRNRTGTSPGSYRKMLINNTIYTGFQELPESLRS